MLKYFRNLVMIMKKIELLAPAGNMKCLHAAVEAGCDAVYLSGNCFGARAFAKNFSDCELVEAINYCHLYGVRVYVTVNTLLYEDEVDDFIKYIDFIHKNNVDAIIIQDLGMFDLVRKTFPNLEIHSSTQMHIHNLDGTQLMEKLGAKRVVLARETSIEQIKHIKENSNIELEIFVHGALCISYSGQCLMSSLIGGRSGNRGQCAGSCRLKYDVIDELGNVCERNLLENEESKSIIDYMPSGITTKEIEILEDYLTSHSDISAEQRVKILKFKDTLEEINEQLFEREENMENNLEKSKSDKEIIQDYISKIKETLPASMKNSVETVLASSAKALSSFSKEEKLVIGKYLTENGVTNSDNLGNFLKKKVEPEHKKELKRDIEIERGR